MINILHNLTFPKIAYGTHATPHDLQCLLYRGGAGTPRHRFESLATSEALGAILENRLALVQKFHEMLTADLHRGLSQVTVMNRIESLRDFYKWCDVEGKAITEQELPHNFHLWVGELLHRVNVKRDIAQMSAYRIARNVDRLTSKVLYLKNGLLSKTALFAPNQKKRVLGIQADKQNLDSTFEFGSMLLALRNTLNTATIRGPLPVKIYLPKGRMLEEWCGLTNHQSENDLINSTRTNAEVAAILELRKALASHQVTDRRNPLINLRIESELLLFIAQTGINLSEAFRLKREKFRFQTIGDDVTVFRTYKSRKKGEALFRIFREYRHLFKEYIDWVDELFPNDGRLFPRLPKYQIPAGSKAPNFQAISARCKILGVEMFKPRALRNTRINWLLRRSNDPKLTAEMAQHTEETLIRVYEKPHHQSAVSGIARFHSLTESAITPPGPGLCIDIMRAPKLILGAATEAPTPDCVNPAGCMFCDFHRDMQNQDYVWSLASYRYCKTLELEQFKSMDNSSHPAAKLIERINNKIEYFKSSDETQNSWVEEAMNRIREGRYHPMFDGFIQLMEVGA
ncbi:site-specific integrase [Pseudomonas sp. Y5-11]|jgi:site-specific recombinase XerD|uniref:site-specific integrase n=1 Tax=Pseudomonas TaxID=286 RepID=UPI000519B213|nr:MULTISPECIES: site-specific integrase [Pseudomonas]ULN81108.1 site-specific integrase [Pseudomonas sp. Y5-11]